MSLKHPIIAVTGSSGAGTTTVMNSFQHIFRREKIKAQIVEGDAFHRYDRKGMREMMRKTEADGDRDFSHFGPQANLVEELDALFRTYGESGGGRTRCYIHDDKEGEVHGQESGTFTPWRDVDANTDLLFYEGLHGAYADDTIDLGKHCD